MHGVDQIVTKYSPCAKKFSVKRSGQLTGLFAAAMAESIKRDKQFNPFAEHSMIASARC